MPPKPAPCTGLERRLKRQGRLALHIAGHRPLRISLRQGASRMANHGDDVAGPEMHSLSNLPALSLQRTAYSSYADKGKTHLRIRSMVQATELGEPK